MNPQNRTKKIEGPRTVESKGKIDRGVKNDDKKSV